MNDFLPWLFRQRRQQKLHRGILPTGGQQVLCFKQGVVLVVFRFCGRHAVCRVLEDALYTAAAWSMERIDQFYFLLPTLQTQIDQTLFGNRSQRLHENTIGDGHVIDRGNQVASLQAQRFDFAAGAN